MGADCQPRSGAVRGEIERMLKEQSRAPLGGIAKPLANVREINLAVRERYSETEGDFVSEEAVGDATVRLPSAGRRESGGRQDAGVRVAGHGPAGEATGDVGRGPGQGLSSNLTLF
jgi:hypothetical protein